MKQLGAFFRYILNINTIWGLMILTAFVACVWQQFAPQKTTIPASALVPGDNHVVVSWKDKDGTSYEYAVNVNLDRTRVRATVADDAGNGGFAVRAANLDAAAGSVVLVWKHDKQGPYTVRVGEQQVAAGRLRNVDTFTDAALSYAETGFKIAFGLVAIMVLFLGLMKVGEDAGIVQLVAKVFYPVIRFLFPQVPENHPANGAILMNVTTTVLGLGNAATPFGLKAMKELQDLNPHPEVASDSQVMLLGYNTAGFALLPTTLIGVRKAAGCSDPLEIIGTCMLAGAVSTITAIVMVKLLGKLPVFSIQTALREEAVATETTKENA
jgi:spore maturation protein A